MKTLDYVDYLVRRTKTLEQIVDELPSAESFLLLSKKLNIEEDAVEKEERINSVRTACLTVFLELCRREENNSYGPQYKK